jgi:hypothetical protein
MPSIGESKMPSLLKKQLDYTNDRPSVSLECKKEAFFLELPVGGFEGYPEGVILLAVEEGAEFGFSFTHGEYAIVPSIRGLNPITGLKASIEPWTSSRGDFCPKDPTHGRLGPKGVCKTCGHEWAPSNYISSSTVGKLPGWRIGPDKYRPFVATADMAKDVAAAVDPSSAVPALGFAFYKSSGATRSPFYFNPWVGTTTNTAFYEYKGEHSWTTSSYCSSTVEKSPLMGVGASKIVEEDSSALKSGADYGGISPESLGATPSSVLDIRLVSMQEIVSIADQLATRFTTGPLQGMPTM